MVTSDGRQFLGRGPRALVVFLQFKTCETHVGGELVMVKIPDHFSVFSFDFGHPTPDESPVEVRFCNLSLVVQCWRSGDCRWRGD